MNLSETYNQIASDWTWDHKEDTWWVPVTDRFIRLLKPGNLVLDVGCASGLKSRLMLEKGLNVVGIDFSEKMIELSKEKVPGGTFLVCDLKQVNTLPYEFDALFLQAVLLHVPKKDVLTVLRQMLTRLKPGGYVYIGVKERRNDQPEEEMVTENDYGYEYTRFFSYFTMDEVQAYFRELHVDLVFSEITSSGKTNWLQVIGKKE